MKFELLREKVKLQKFSEAKHAQSGEPIQVLDKEIEVWAQFKAAKSVENFENNRSVSFGIGVFYMRWRSDLDGHWKILDRAGRQWAIIGEPRELGFREGLEVAVERAN